MRTWKDRMVSAIQRDGEPEWQVGHYMNQILIRIPAGSETFAGEFVKVKNQILACIKRNVSMRSDDVLFYIKMGREEGRFIIQRSFDLPDSLNIAPEYNLINKFVV